MTINVIAFVVPGQPQGKGRHRVGTIAGRARMFTPAKTVAYEGLIAFAAQEAMRGVSMMLGPVTVEVDAVCQIPASWSKRKQQQAEAHAIKPTSKPDADNVLKAACDGMNGIVFKDDSQAVSVTVRKFYGLRPELRVRVAALTETT